MSSNNITQNLKNTSSEALDWALIQKDMKSKLGSDIYESWLRKIDFVEEMNNYILLSVSTRFIRDWITSRYLDQILQIIKAYKKDLTRIEFKIIEKSSKDETQESIIGIEKSEKEKVRVNQSILVEAKNDQQEVVARFEMVVSVRVS